MASSNNAGLGTIGVLVSELQAQQTTKEKKSNTVTATIGSIATLGATALAAFTETNTDLPSWFPYLIVVLGLIGTTYSVSKTKNGVTDSVVEKLNAALLQKIEENHFHGEEVPNIPRHATTDVFPALTLGELDDAAVLRAHELRDALGFNEPK